MKLAIFGPTGTAGTALLDQALAAGHHVRALARTPAKITNSSPGLTVLEGNALDPHRVSETVAGCDAVLSALGGFADPASISTGTAVICTAMRTAGIRRIVVIQGYHLDFPGDPHNPGRKMILPLLWLGSRSLIRDSRSMATALQASELDWTVVRAPRITRGQTTGRAQIGLLKLGPWNSAVNADIAELALHSLTDPAAIRTAPMIASRGMQGLGALGYWLLRRQPERV